MAYAISDGAPCREASWQWTAADGSTAPLINAGWTHSEDWYIGLGEPEGFYDLPDADNNTEPRTSQRGELGLSSEELGKTITPPLVVMAKTLPILRTKCALLRHAFSDRTYEGTMLLHPHATYSTIDWYFLAKTLFLRPQGDFSKVNTRLPFVQPYRLSVRMLDPRFYVAGDPEEISGASAATVVATNQGGASTDAIYTITVPSGSPDIHIENLSVPTPAGHAELWLRAVPAGTLVVDTRNRTLILNGLSAEGYFDSAATDMFDELIPALKRGANSIKVTGGAWSMTFRHASL